MNRAMIIPPELLSRDHIHSYENRAGTYICVSPVLSTADDRLLRLYNEICVQEALTDT